MGEPSLHYMALKLMVPYEALLGRSLPLAPMLPNHIYIGIYRNSHHHLMHLVNQIGGGVLWANLYLRSDSPFGRNSGHWRRSPEPWPAHHSTATFTSCV